ncbi:hypothetical protein [Deinococcus multiflagellatus]|uniref:Uncharacterized protein n=1 Tax=Deinococcus multiflagellatus TaxID=1656887 RepID=A0ABW1ZMN6_9DEIO|nr:hypothetical protein [Deinococcus multiflagellatus]MBZ9712319.1 hypothetical protein [Deinococcus multiflagellatus]
MKHVMFPTVAAADAFIADMQQQGLVAPTLGRASYMRSGGTSTTTTTTDTVTADASAGAEDAGAGAVKGTGVGAVAGAVAGVLASGAVVATGGLALPVILGMTALGSGVGAAVGATGGAMGVDENHDGRTSMEDTYEVDHTSYDHMHSTMNSGGRVVGVEDSVPFDAVQATAARHGGQIMDDSGMNRRPMGSTGSSM